MRIITTSLAVAGSVSLLAASVFAIAAGDKKAEETTKAVVSVEYKPSGDAKAGKADAETCVACHGADGNSAAPTFPKLAGQGAKYLIKQMQDMKSVKGEPPLREVAQMAAVLPDLDDTKIANIAAFYAEQKTTTGKANPELVALGQQIYRAGVPEAGVAACAACHGPQGEGMPSAGYPALAGQHAGYIESQLKAFRASGRGDFKGPYRNNDGETMMMRSTAAGLTDAQITALGSYINGLY